MYHYFVLFVCLINSYANPADYAKILHKIIAFFKTYMYHHTIYSHNLLTTTIIKQRN